MSCTTIRKFLYAFADGQLGVEANCQVLDHLKMCGDCSRVVEQHQALRTRLRDSLGKVQVPQGLHERVCQAVSTGKTATRRRGVRVLLTFKPLALAACITLVATVAWQYAIRPGGTDQSAGGQFVLASLEDEAASMIVSKHTMCCDGAASHHNQALPQTLTGLAAVISARYDDIIQVLAPDLSDHGFAFESANLCGLRGGCGNGHHHDNESPDDAPEEHHGGVNGGHLLYVKGDASVPTRLSVFSVPRWDELDRLGSVVSDRDEICLVSVSPGADGREMCIAVWHQDATSYVCVGQVDVPSMKDIVTDVRIALGNSPTLTVLAAHSWLP
jgi:anti-sigma factor RsiW